MLAGAVGPGLLSSSSWAQGAPATPAGEVIVGVEVRGAPDDTAAKTVAATFGVVSGDAFDPEQIRQGIRRVFLSGPYRDVRVWRSKGEGGVRLVLELFSDVLVGVVTVKTDGRIPEDRVREALAIKLGERFEPQRLPRVEREVAAFCAELGYLRPRVKVSAEQVGEAEVALTVVVHEGAPLTVRNVEVAGDGRVALFDVAAWSGLAPGADYDGLVREQGLKDVVAALVERRHLRAQATLSVLDIDEDALTVDLLFDIEAGPRYHVDFVGNHALTRAQLGDVISVRKIPGLGKEQVRATVQSLLDVYHQQGFARCTVRTREVPAYRPFDDDAEEVLQFVIDEGQRAVVTAVRLEGVVSKDVDVLTEELAAYVDELRPPTSLLESISQAGATMILESQGPDEALPDQASGPLYIDDLYRRATERLIDEYRSVGFLEVKVYGPELLWGADGREVVVRYRVVEGTQLLVTSVEFVPLPTLPLADVLSDATFEPGEPANLYAIEETRVQLENVLRNNGFPFAEVTESLVPDDTGGASVVFRLNEGPRVRVGKIIVQGNDVTQSFVIRDRLALSSGDWFTQDKIALSRRRLLTTGLFSSVRIRLVPGRIEHTVRDVLVEVKERKLFSIETGAGASVEDGPRVFLAGEARNVAGLGAQIKGRGQLNYPAVFYPLVYQDSDPNHPQYRAQAAFPQFPWLYYFEGQSILSAELPDVYGLPFSARLHGQAVGLREIRPAFTLLRGSVLAGIDVAPLPWWRATMDIEGEISDFDCPRDFQIGQSCGQGNINLTRRRDNGFIQQTTYRVSTTFDLRDDPFTPQKGLYLFTSGEVAAGSGILRDDQNPGEGDEVNSDFVKSSSVASGYIPLGDRFILAGQARLGFIVPVFSKDNYIPLFKRFYLGGTRSVRGFFEDEILPADDPRWPATQARPEPGFEGLVDARNSLGGTFVCNAKAELRARIIGDLDFGLFFDVGQLLEDVRNFQLGGFAAGTGFGFRYNTPVGPFAIDVGWRVINGQRELAPLVSLERLNIHFSIGTF